MKKSIPRPGKPGLKSVPHNQPANKDNAEKLSVSFAKFSLTPICLKGKFNNHFKDNQQYISVVTDFLNVILPKITSHSYNELTKTNESRQLHFHTIDEAHRIVVKEILKAYNFSDIAIEQMLESDNIYEFSASLGHVYAARIVCHKVGNILYCLFIDTNHHIYMNEKFVKESLFFELCPTYLTGECVYMPNDCFAVSYLDEQKIAESFEYKVKP